MHPVVQKLYSYRENSPEPVESELEDDVFAEFIGIAETSLDDAMSGYDRQEWEDAIISEIRSILKNDTWDIVKRTNDQHVIGSRLVLTKKQDTGEAAGRMKARIVAKGYRQRYGVEYQNTFAPVARLESIRLLAALAVELDLKIHQLDITTAYLNGQLEEQIFMEPSEMFKEMLSKLIRREGKQSIIGKRAREMLSCFEAGGDVCLLKKSLYGLRQAGRQWNRRLDTVLRTIGLTPTTGEPCMYHTSREGAILIVLIYVDDFRGISRSKMDREN